MNASDEFERLINTGAIRFAPAALDALTEWGRSVVGCFLDRHRIAWQLGDQRVGQSYCLKLDDPVLRYLDILEETQEFMWCTEGHHDSIHPDDASIILLQRDYPQLRGRTVRTEGLRRTILGLPGGEQVVVDDLRGDRDED